MKAKMASVVLLCTAAVFLATGLSYSQQHDLSIEERTMEPGVMWELTKETEGEESYKYLEGYVKYFPDSPKVQDAMWYMISMIQMEEVNKDPFPLLDEYAKAFPTDEANVAFARACLYYCKADWGFWLLTTTQEGVRENKEAVLKGIGLFQKAAVLAKPKDRFKGFKSPTRGGTILIMPYPFWDSGNIQESAKWNIAVGYERLKMWKEAIEAYSIHLLEYPESDEVDKIKAKIYLLRQKLQEELK